MVARSMGKYFDDFDRLAEAINSLYGENIDDETSFGVAFNNYMLPDRAGRMGVSKSDRQFGKDSFKNRTQKIYKSKFGLSSTQTSDDKAIFKLAGGKNLPQDRKRTAKIVYPNTIRGRRRFADAGADEVDLDKVDTKKGKKVKRLKKVKHDFNITGTQKKRITRARQTTVTIQGKNIKKFRDRRGRFVSR